MKHILLELSIQGASNGGILMLLAQIYGGLFMIVCLEPFANRSSSIDAKNIWIPPFDASGYDDSNKLCFIFLWPLDDEIIDLKLLLKIAIYKKFFNHCIWKYQGGSSCIGRRMIKLSLLDSSIQGAFNDTFLRF